MYISELFGENVKKLVSIRIRPTESTIIISGANGAGKTSALDLIWYTLGGGDSLKDTPQPIRKGQTKAKAITVLSEVETEEPDGSNDYEDSVWLEKKKGKPLFTVTRTWTEKGSYLKITNAEGEPIQSPQELLDSFKSQLSFDPLKFSQMPEKDQRELLLKLADIDLEVLDNEIAEIREQRRLKGQEGKLISGEREEIKIKDLPEHPIQYINIDQKLEQAIKNNNDIEKLGDGIRENKDMIEDCKIKIADLQRKIEYAEVEIKHHEKWLSEHAVIDVNSIRKKMVEAEEINEQIRVRERNKALDAKTEIARQEYAKFTSKIEELEDIKKGILDDAKMPIKGLTINDTGVQFNVIPLSQLSSSEQLKVSMATAMALNPKLKILRITDGSLLDEKSMEMISKMAEENGFQVWLEKVDTSGEIGFFIEDGEIKNGR